MYIYIYTHIHSTIHRREFICFLIHAYVTGIAVLTLDPVVPGWSEDEPHSLGTGRDTASMVINDGNLMKSDEMCRLMSSRNFAGYSGL